MDVEEYSDRNADEKADDIMMSLNIIHNHQILVIVLQLILMTKIILAIRIIILF
jgi:hypothetical protein